MSQLDVHEIICPVRDRELEQLRRHRDGSQQVILALRRKLIETDSTLPDEYDGTAWMLIEAEHRVG